MKTPTRLLAACLLLMVLSVTAAENLTIAHDWVRVSIPGQQTAAAYMTLTSSEESSLVKVESDIAEDVEIHSMAMENGIMQMRMLETLPLPPGKPVLLQPSGFHLMLFNLNAPLTPGKHVLFRLHVKDPAGHIRVVEHQSAVRAKKD